MDRFLEIQFCQIQVLVDGLVQTELDQVERSFVEFNESSEVLRTAQDDVSEIPRWLETSLAKNG